MAKLITITGARDGRVVDLPQHLDSLVIALDHGDLYIDLSGQVPGMVLIRAAVGARERPAPTRLILSPMDGGRLAIGVIRSH